MEHWSDAEWAAMPSTDKMVEVLAAGPCTVPELVQETGLAGATVHTLLGTLRRIKWVECIGRKHNGKREHPPKVWALTGREAA